VKRDLAALMEREHDVLVVGGGIHGAAAAWDAAQRGLKTALVEARDFGSGASWNSLKTIHGGLRSLQSLDLRRLRESVRERRALLRVAPEIVKPLPFVVPVRGHGAKGREAFAIGLALNDWLSSDRNEGLPPEQHIPAGRLLEPFAVASLVPGLDPRGLTAGALWHDAQVVSSERLVVGFVRAAADAGACVANHAPVVGLLGEEGRVTGARVKDALGGGVEMEVRARLVLNAAGPGSDAILRMAGLARQPLPLLRAWNLVLRRAAGPAVAIGGSDSGRYLFLVPWRDRSIVGTDYAPADTVAGPTDVDSLLAAASRALPFARIERADVALVHRGLVPGQGDASGLFTRPRIVDHAAADGVAGLVTALGVKYTTARAVAERAVDLAVARLGARVERCRTATTPLAHARPLAGDLVARTAAAVDDEMALTLNDAILRRLDLGTTGPPAADDVEAVAGVMAERLGWDAARQADENRALIETYRS